MDEQVLEVPKRPSVRQHRHEPSVGKGIEDDGNLREDGDEGDEQDGEANCPSEGRWQFLFAAVGRTAQERLNLPPFHPSFARQKSQKAQRHDDQNEGVARRVFQRRLHHVEDADGNDPLVVEDERRPQVGEGEDEDEAGSGKQAGHHQRQRDGAKEVPTR